MRDEASSVGREVAVRAVAWGITLFSLLVFLILAGVAVMMAALSLSAFAHLSLTWYVTLFLVEMVVQGFTGGSIQTIGADVAPAQARGVFLGLWRFTGQSGVTLGPIAFALLAELAYGASFLFLSVTATVVTVLLIRHVPETHDDGASSEELERFRRSDLLEVQRRTHLPTRRTATN
jgi:MFS family permease